jgi:LytS/YehU family sensor histidine kinase
VHADVRGRAATAEVPTTEAPRYRLHVASLRAGRRLLSDDLALLEWAAHQAARRIDLVRVAHERCEREARELEAVRLATEAELRALRAQLNPHFLFNALTTVSYLVQAAPDRAVDTIRELTGLLRALLQSPAGGLVPLDDELAIVGAYLAIERARFEERLAVTVDADDAARRVLVPPLLLQPLVENAVKHGVAPLRRGAAVRVWARVEPAAGAGARLRVRVTDDGAGADAATLAARRAAGFGLSSVERRLERQYGGAATFAFEAHAGRGATVELTLPVASPPAARAMADPVTDAEAGPTAERRIRLVS